MASTLAFLLHAAAAETASGAGAAVDLGATEIASRNTLRVAVLVTAVSAGAGLTITVETSPDGIASWRSLGSVGPITALGTQTTRTMLGAERFIRASWTLTGSTPSVTFEVLGQALTQYASMLDVQELSLPATALEPPVGMTQVAFDAAVNALLGAISAKVDHYLRGSYRVPLTGSLGPPSSYPEEFTKAVADIAAYEILTTFGSNPGEYDENYRLRAEAQERWLNAVAKGTITLDLPPPAPPPDDGVAFGGGFAVISDPPRGW